MSIHSQLNPLPSSIEIEKGEGGDIKRLEKSFKSKLRAGHYMLLQLLTIQRMSLNLEGRHNIKI